MRRELHHEGLEEVRRLTGDIKQPPRRTSSEARSPEAFPGHLPPALPAERGAAAGR